MKTIKAKRGEEIIVDDDVFEHMSTYNWTVNNRGYATAGEKGYHSCPIMMHRKMMEPIEPGLEVHHKNGNKLDNRAENLQLLTRRDHRATIRKMNQYGGPY